MRRALTLSLLAACQRGEPVLDADADVVVDAHGVAHVRAATSHDAFFLQGWVTARDRMFQMDLTRRRAQGRRAELLGEERYLSDVQSRALRFADWGQRTADWLRENEPETWMILEAYADGVNAWLDAALAGEEDLPPQIVALDYTPAPWTPADSMAIEKMITAGLSMRPDQEITLGLMRTLLGADSFHDLYVYEPFDRDYTHPTWFDEGGPRRRRDGSGGSPALDALGERLRDAGVRGLGGAWTGLDLAYGGSNNWAVDGAHSASGAALLFGDSHQGVVHPATYYLIHLDTVSAGGDLDVIGATFPGAPLVMFGHSRHLAWTPTTSLLDVSDAWLETWADASQDAVLHDGVAVPVERRDETFVVATPDGPEERTLELVDVPHHGPVLPADALGLPLPVTVSLGWTGYQPRSTAKAYLALARARDVDAGLAAFADMFTGGMNWVLGDDQGRIAWTNETHLPSRQTLDPDVPPIGLLPGTGGYDWVPSDGRPYTQVTDALPRLVDPPDGFIATANNDPVGQTDDGDPFNEPTYLAAVFDIGTRSYQPRRLLAAHLADDGRVSFEEARDIQLDTTSRLAEVLLPYLADAAARRPDLVTPELADLLDRLAAWDRRCGVDDVAPSVFHLWLMRLAWVAMADESGGLVGELVFDDMSYQLGLVAVKFLRHWLERSDADRAAIDAGDLPFPSRSGRNLFDDATTAEVEPRDAILLRALAEALAEGERVFGTRDVDAWRWGDWHQLILTDPADAVVPDASAPPVPKPGGLYTVDVGDFSWFVDGQIPTTLAVSNAPSNRFAFEMTPGVIRGEFALPGGQSERPGDPHHNDLLADYVAGRYRPMWWRTEDVDAHAERTWRFDRRGGWE